MGVALEAMADGGVMAGIPFQMSLRMSAQTMIVRITIYYYDIQLLLVLMIGRC